jgi:hypothetical protein
MALIVNRVVVVAQVPTKVLHVKKDVPEVFSVTRDILNSGGNRLPDIWGNGGSFPYIQDYSLLRGKAGSYSCASDRSTTSERAPTS